MLVDGWIIRLEDIMSRMKLLVLIEWIERVRCLDGCLDTVGDGEMLRE
jgi:hypothetical protein